MRVLWEVVAKAPWLGWRKPSVRYYRSEAECLEVGRRICRETGNPAGAYAVAQLMPEQRYWHECVLAGYMEPHPEYLAWLAQVEAQSRCVPVAESVEDDDEDGLGECSSCGGSGGGDYPMHCRSCEGTGRADCGRPQRSEPEYVDADERASRCGDWSAWRAREW